MLNIKDWINDKNTSIIYNSNSNSSTSSIDLDFENNTHTNDDEQYIINNNNNNIKKDIYSIKENILISTPSNSSISSTKDESLNELKSCSWQQTAGLMLSEYIVLAIMSFPWSYSVLGLIPGLILTLFVASTVLYTGLIISDFCEKHPSLRNVCDISIYLFGNYKSIYYITCICFLANNILIQGLHVLVGAKFLNTITNHSQCTVVFSIIVVIISICFSWPRRFSTLSFLGYFSAATMFIAVILAMIFAGIQSHPYKFDGTPVHYTLFPKKGTTYVDAMCAFLNIVYTFVGQITYPQFISEMRNPKEFKKVLWLVSICEVIIFSLAGSIMYVYVGTYYMTAPAFGSLEKVYKIISFSFAVPTIIFAGALYANVSTKFIFFEFFKNDHDMLFKDSFKSWFYWLSILTTTWILAFVIAEVIPFFSDLLSLMSSLFDCWFGFIFWGVAYLRLKNEKYNEINCFKNFNNLNFIEKIHYIIAISLIFMGIYILGPGLYATISSIVTNFENNVYGTVFSCTSNGI